MARYGAVRRHESLKYRWMRDPVRGRAEWRNAILPRRNLQGLDAAEEPRAPPPELSFNRGCQREFAAPS